MEWYDGDEKMVERYLPSVLGPLVYPDEIRHPAKVSGRKVRSSTLTERELLLLQARSTGLVAKVCAELVALHRLLRRAGNRPLLGMGAGYDARPMYSGCTLVLESNDRIGEFLDDYMNMEYQSGESTEYSCFINFSDTKQGIREQYAQWGLAFQMLHHLDRLLALVVSG
jgi:PRTRC genetic system protein F